MAKTSNIFLIGLMGVGKTTIGKTLAKLLDLTFYDSDQEIERATGADIPWIFDLEGEEGFRQRESKAIAELTLMQGIVLATGGGVVLRPENREALSARGIVVYLHTDLQELLQRTGRNQNRPLLATRDPKQVLESLLAVREPLYRELADYVYDTSGRSVTEIAQHIADDLREKGYF